MQVQRITPYQTYSSSRVGRTDAKNPNFGLKLTLAKDFVTDVKKLVGDAGFQQIQKQFEEMAIEENLIGRFQQVFNGNQHLRRLFGMNNVPKKCKTVGGGNINPVELFPNWKTLEAELRFEDLGEHVSIDCVDTQPMNASKSYPKLKNPVNAIICALNDVLNEYAEKKIGLALSVLKEKK